MIMLGPEAAALAILVVLPWVAARLIAHVPLRRAIAEGVFAAYMVALIGVVFLPLRPVSAEYLPYLWANVNLVPMRTVVEIVREFRGQIVQQLVGNVLLFVPLGFLLPILSARCRRFLATAGVALAMSVGIELVQLAMLLSLTSARSVDVDDVILNVTGAALGYLAWRGLRALTSRASATVATAEESA